MANNTIKAVQINNTAYTLEAANGLYYIEGTGTTDSTNKISTWTGNSDSITSYYDGLTIKYKIGVAGQSTVTLNINGLGAKTVYRFSTTKLTTQFPIGSIITLTYHEDLNSGCWMANDYDANTNTQMRVYRQTTGYNADYPLLVSRTKAADIANKDENGSYESIYGVMWNDTTKVPTLNPSTGELKAVKFTGAVAGNADTATALKTARTISLTGDATGSASFDGSANASITVAIKDDSHNHTNYVTTEELNTAIANAITTALNTEV